MIVTIVVGITLLVGAYAMGYLHGKQSVMRQEVQQYIAEYLSGHVDPGPEGAPR